MAMDQMYTDALRELEQVKQQRDRLKVALRKIAGLPKFMNVMFDEAETIARAALEEAGDE